MAGIIPPSEVEPKLHGPFLFAAAETKDESKKNKFADSRYLTQVCVRLDCTVASYAWSDVALLEKAEGIFQ